MNELLLWNSSRCVRFGQAYLREYLWLCSLTLKGLCIPACIPSLEAPVTLFLCTANVFLQISKKPALFVLKNKQSSSPPEYDWVWEKKYSHWCSVITCVSCTEDQTEQGLPVAAHNVAFSFAPGCQLTVCVYQYKYRTAFFHCFHCPSIPLCLFLKNFFSWPKAYRNKTCLLFFCVSLQSKFSAPWLVCIFWSSHDIVHWWI